MDLLGDLIPATGTLALVLLFWPTWGAAGSDIPRVAPVLAPLDLAQPLDHNAIMSAGQLGGQLFPTREPDTTEAEANAAFRRAIKQWNRHVYRDAVGLVP